MVGLSGPPRAVHAKVMDCPPFSRDTHTQTKVKDLTIQWSQLNMALGYLYTSTCHPRAWKTTLETVPDDSAVLVMVDTAHPEDTNIHDRSPYEWWLFT